MGKKCKQHGRALTTAMVCTVYKDNCRRVAGDGQGKKGTGKLLLFLCNVSSFDGRFCAKQRIVFAFQIC